MQEKSDRGKACAYSSLYIFILARSFRKLMVYSRGILEWYDSEEKEKLKNKAPSGKKKDKKIISSETRKRGIKRVGLELSI